MDTTAENFYVIRWCGNDVECVNGESSDIESAWPEG